MNNDEFNNKLNNYFSKRYEVDELLKERVINEAKNKALRKNEKRLILVQITMVLLIIVATIVLFLLNYYIIFASIFILTSIVSNLIIATLIIKNRNHFLVQTY